MDQPDSIMKPSRPGWGDQPDSIMANCTSRVISTSPLDECAVDGFVRRERGVGWRKETQ